MTIPRDVQITTKKQDNMTPQNVNNSSIIEYKDIKVEMSNAFK
jgi:hypothetical protein